MIEVAISAVEKAGKAAIAMRGGELTRTHKREGVASDFVTEADIVAERLILETLKIEFPKHSYLSEEIGLEDNGSEYLWVIDPVDGTGVYSVGFDHFAVVAGLLKDGQPHLGVVMLPGLQRIYSGVVGNGAWMNGEEVAVSGEEVLSKSIVGLEFGHSGDRMEELGWQFAALIEEVNYPLVMGCASYGLVMVASGLTGAYLHRAYLWDFVAGAAIVEAAGGKVTGFEGEKIDWLGWDFEKMNRVVASNGLIHDEVVGKLTEERASE